MKDNLGVKKVLVPSKSQIMCFACLKITSLTIRIRGTLNLKNLVVLI
jgi:hypothetical protein